VAAGKPLPQLAQPALQMGKHAGNQIRKLQAGQPTVAFRYRDKGIMATIGYRSAVVQLPGQLRIRGTTAWLAWLALHLVTLLGGRNRISALVNMSWRYLSWRRAAASSWVTIRQPSPFRQALHRLPVPIRSRRHGDQDDSRGPR
jgi:NADH:quinone reductase (non-electrogenic)